MEKLVFKTAFKYPFNRAKGMWNILWIFVPIIGWFALGGYRVRIVQGFTKGEFKELPVLKFEDDFKLGFYMFLKGLPFAIAYILLSAILKKISPSLEGLVNFFVALFVIPILAINFFKKQTVESFFEFNLIKVVFNNLEDYVMVILNSFLLGIVFMLLSLVLVGIPANFFSENIFLGDFYRRNVKEGLKI